MLASFRCLAIFLGTLLLATAAAFAQDPASTKALHDLFVEEST